MKKESKASGKIGLMAPPNIGDNTRSRIRTPTREGYNIYKAYKEKVQQLAEETKLPVYMQSKFKPKVADDEDPEDLMFATNGTNFSIHPEVDPQLMGGDSPNSNSKGN